MTRAGGQGPTVHVRTQGTLILVSRDRGAWHGPPRLELEYQGHTQARGPSRGRGWLTATGMRRRLWRAQPGQRAAAEPQAAAGEAAEPAADPIDRLIAGRVLPPSRRGQAPSPRPRGLAASLANATAPLAERAIRPISAALTRRASSVVRRCRRRGSWARGNTHAPRSRRAGRALDDA